jgi:hypothetical protein
VLARVAVTVTVAYCTVKPPPAASMAAPNPARISRCPATGIYAQNADVGTWSSHSSLV